MNKYLDIPLPIYKKIDGVWHQAGLRLDCQPLKEFWREMIKGLSPVYLVPLGLSIVIGLIGLLFKKDKCE